MAGLRMSRRLVNLAAGWICLGSAALNWWNMLAVGFTPLRILLASILTLIGLWLLAHEFRANRSGPT